MVSAQPQQALSGWGPLADLPPEMQRQLQQQLKPFRLKPGQQLNDLEHLPPGVVLLKSGQMRLLGLDQRKELFTLERFGPGELVGVEQLLRGVTGQALAASTAVEGLVLPTETFLQLIQNTPELQQAFRTLKAWELYAVTAARQDPRHPAAKELLQWAQGECSLAEHEVLLLGSGSHDLPVDSGLWLVSSGNVERQNPGTLLQSPVKVEVLGRMPARLLPLPAHWPPQRQVDPPLGQLVKPASGDELAEVEPDESNAPQLQREALEDWYGRMRDDGTFPQHSGKGAVEEPLACLRMLSRHFDLPFRKDVLQRILKDQLARAGEAGLGLQPMAAICDLLALRATGLQPGSPDLLCRTPFPALTLIDGHPLVLWDSRKGQILIGDPVAGQRWMEAEALLAQAEGEQLGLLTLERNSNAPKARFGLSWFIPSIQKHKGALIQVVITSFFVQLLQLFNPLLIQQIIDAVISQGNFSTLNVYGTLLVAMALAQALLGALRTYLFSDTTNRIDISLGATIIHHLLRLPLGYFAKRPVGEVSSRIAELEKIRSFLTGTALTVLLDAVFSVVYIGVMMAYSVTLTFASLAVVPLFVGLTIGVAPIIRRQIRQRAEANAKVQSHLVETLSGMETVKGQGMELPSVWRWEQLYGGQIEAGFRNTITSTAAGSTNQFLGQVSSLVVIWVGAMLVLKGELTVGALIAFRILSGYVNTPILRLAGLWQNFQETALSLERLSDIVDHQEEIEIAGEGLPPLPPIQGAVSYEAVNFRFGSSGPLQLLNVSFDIPAGSFVGIVGSSGSGKSTMLKLLTRLFDPLEGTIRIDGYDIAKVDLYSLRSQVGVVPQDSLLFDGTIQANLALSRPDASFEEITGAAQVACAHDFIQSLPGGYSNSVGERGSALSGGQRQRMAIARMVLKRPRLLVLDEATSALDVDTEQQVTRNLAEVYRGSTVLFITHRLGSLRHADRILVMHEGNLVEQGTHNELIKLGGRYATLYRQQEAGQE
ncbi:MAG: ATP-binding cassette domain-containing protein [Synechococcus sp. MED-G71]|nr:MAG: ATP-binding cassette domain-containing protein [Synechococcus sp. MED-G71]RPF76727.1 MAG: ATP-binding cassette domain-containing protein [Synechococcus sp. TMED155]|tara:strand:- start:7029 stop:10013 length:2985 start_codon:yes stop_codon:yes gene_type:complete